MKLDFLKTLIEKAEAAITPKPEWLPNMESADTQEKIKNVRFIKKLEEVYDFNDAANAEVVKALCEELIEAHEVIRYYCEENKPSEYSYKDDEGVVHTGKVKLASKSFKRGLDFFKKWGELE